jgi:hypothetical protein
MGKVMTMNVISFGCLASMCLYTSLSMDSKERKIEKIGTGILAAAGILHLYSLCNAASKATSSVRLASLFKLFQHRDLMISGPACM